MAFRVNSPHFNGRCVATMCVVKYYVLIFIALFLDCYALNCRSDGGPKENELKNIYRNCLKRQDNKNSSNNRGYSGDEAWKEPRGYNQRSQWDRESRSGRDDRMGGRDDRISSRDDRMSSRDDRISAREDRMNSRDDRMGSRDDRTGRNGMGVRDDMYGTGFGRSDISSRDGFQQNDDFGNISGQESGYSYRSTTQSPRRFRRDKRTGQNSGQRSQYNPNSSTQRPGYEDSYRNDERNSSENYTSKEIDKKACALHCFMENLEMIGDNGMPDRYLVTHAITKDVKNEDLRDFLQESIEECFQILDNENTEDKCEFSKNLLVCLSEKGRANCDDWKDDIQL